MAQAAKEKQTDQKGGSRRAPALLVVLLLLGLIARGLISYQQTRGGDEAESADAKPYLTVARNLIQRGEFVSSDGRRAAVMPGYPVFAAGVFRLFGVVADPKGLRRSLPAVRVAGGYGPHAKAEGVKGEPDGDSLLPLAMIQAVIGTLTIAVVYDLGRRISGCWAGLVAAALLTVNPMHILFCGRALPQTLFVFLFVLFIWSVVLFREGFRFAGAILAGVLFSAAVYVMPSAILFAPVLLVALAIGGQREACFKGWLVGAVVLLVALSPWVIRNGRVLGRFVVTTTSVGESMYDGAQPVADPKGVKGEAADAEAVASRKRLAEVTQEMDEVRRDRAYRTAAWKEIFANRRRFVRLAWGRIKTMWHPARSTVETEGKIYEVLGYSAFLPTAILAVLGIICLVRRKLWAAVLMILPAVYWTILAAFVVGSPGRRLAAMPLIMVLSGVGLAWIFSREMPAPEKKGAADA